MIGAPPAIGGSPLMPDTPNRSWTRHFVYRSERTRTTWAFRIGVLILLLAGGWFARKPVAEAIGRSLVCEANASVSDAILVENFDTDYLLFERARQLREQGLAPRVLVPVPIDQGTLQPRPVAAEMAMLLARLARAGDIEIVPVREVEPITLNTAHDVRKFTEREGLRSLIVVTPLFRSRRAMLVHAAVHGGRTRLSCAPVEGARGILTWTHAWHGVQEVLEQWMKLQYYRFYALRWKAR